MVSDAVRVIVIVPMAVTMIVSLTVTVIMIVYLIMALIMIVIVSLIMALIVIMIMLVSLTMAVFMTMIVIATAFEIMNILADLGARCFMVVAVSAIAVRFVFVMRVVVVEVVAIVTAAEFSCSRVMTIVIRLLPSVASAIVAVLRSRLTAEVVKFIRPDIGNGGPFVFVSHMTSSITYEQLFIFIIGYH